MEGRGFGLPVTAWSSLPRLLAWETQLLQQLLPAPPLQFTQQVALKALIEFKSRNQYYSE